jgi:hypothetical protein
MKPTAVAGRWVPRIQISAWFANHACRSYDSMTPASIADVEVEHIVLAEAWASFWLPGAPASRPHDSGRDGRAPGVREHRN